MYLDFSIKKLLGVVLVAWVLGVGIIITFDTKHTMFGKTPFFQAIELWWKERSLYVMFSLEYLTQRENLVSNLFGFSGGVEYARGSTTSPPTIAKAVPVLTYHRLVDEVDRANTPVDKFKEQMYILKKAGWQTITLKDFEEFMDGEKELPPKSFLLTFDDGAKDSFYPVDPLLKVLGYNGVNYIIVKSSKTAGSKYYLSPEEIKRMLATGRWEIGSHSYDGHHLSPIDANGTMGSFYADLVWSLEENRPETPEDFTNRLSDDMQRSREELEKTYGVEVSTFAFPYGETGMITHGNFPQGIETSTKEAEKVYTFGFLQTHGDDYSFNYPQYRSFLTKRIHVDHDWSAERLLSVMENGFPKDLPYYDNLEKNQGWLPSWGEVEAGWEQLILKALPETTSASAILDGAALWKNYTFSTVLDWNLGSTLLLANVTDARTYRACVFSKERVSIQYMEEGKERTTLSEKSSQKIQYGNDVRLGIEVRDGKTTCLYDGKTVLEASGLTDRMGGIGIQTWHETPGSASILVKEISVEQI